MYTLKIGKEMKGALRRSVRGQGEAVWGSLLVYLAPGCLPKFRWEREQGLAENASAR